MNTVVRRVRSGSNIIMMMYNVCYDKSVNTGETARIDRDKTRISRLSISVENSALRTIRTNIEEFCRSEFHEQDLVNLRINNNQCMMKSLKLLYIFVTDFTRFVFRAHSYSYVIAWIVQL